MTSRARRLTPWLIAGCAVACSNETPPDDGSVTPGEGPSPKNGDGVRLVCPGCTPPAELPLGGETSEFDGVNHRNPNSSSGRPRPIKTARALSDPALASWLPLIEGERELDLRWRDGFRGAALGDRAATTRISLGVAALGAADVAFEDSSHRTLYLDVEVRVRSADGALDAAFAHTLDLAPWGLPEGSELAHSVPGGAVYPFAQAQGWLQLGFDPELELRGGLGLELEFSARGVRGQLSAQVQYSESPAWLLLTGTFPDDGCGAGEWPLALAAAPAGSAQSAQARFDAVNAALRAQPFTAQDESGRSQTLTLELGAADHACEAPSEASVYAPLRLRSNGIDLRYEARIQLLPDAGQSLSAEIWTRREFIAAERLAALTGISPPPTLSAFVAPRVHTRLSSVPEQISGELLLELSDTFSYQRSLRWCSGDRCD